MTSAQVQWWRRLHDWADVIHADFQTVISRYLQNISTYPFCTAERMLSTIIMQIPRLIHVCFLYKSTRYRPILRPLWLMTSAAADVISVLSVGVVQAASSPILLFPDVRQLFKNISDELRFVLASWHININFHIIPCNVTRAVRW